MTISTPLKINNQIRAVFVRLIDETAKQIGTVSLQEAMQLSKDKGLDLVEISPDSNPPVVKIMDYSKFLLRKRRGRRNKSVYSASLKPIQKKFRLAR